MPISPERRFMRQRPGENAHAGLVIPANATMKPEIARMLQHHGLNMGPPSQPPHRFSFHYVEAPIDASLLEDGAVIDSGVYEFSVRDAVVAVFDLPIFENDVFCWSFSSTHWVEVLAATKIGETLDVIFEQPFEQAFHVAKSHFPSGVPNCGYCEYAVQLGVDVLRPDWFRVVSSFEPQSQRTDSRLPFFFGFRVYGRRATDPKFPVWRELLGDAVRQALYGRWQHALLYTAFALEAFIDQRLAERLQLAGLGEKYTDHVLRVGERKDELHALNHLGPQLSKSGVDKTVTRLNSDVFTPRNQTAHGKTLDAGTPEQFVRALKTTVEFIWDWDTTVRHLLVPVLPASSPESMIDEQLLADCQSE